MNTDMACSEKRKVDSEIRAFNPEWTDWYMFILHTGSSKPVCLIWSERVAITKSGNVKRQYETKHKSYKRKRRIKGGIKAVIC